MDDPILITGAAGRVGGVGRAVVERLLARQRRVRALVRCEDERAAALRALGADVVVADLTRAPDVVRALDGCRRMYFGLGVAAYYLEATVATASAARARRDLEVMVNMSQMTVSQMSFTSRTESAQQRLQWLGEQVLNWSGLPVVHIRPTIFLQTLLLLTRSRATALCVFPSGTDERRPWTQATLLTSSPPCSRIQAAHRSYL
jgi:uncharacterized protein YbjT (DUF2867 family)